MTRSKAFLEKGVEIRWNCAPSLIKEGDDTPEKPLSFPGGLKDYLDTQVKDLAVWSKACSMAKANGPMIKGVMAAWNGPLYGPMTPMAMWQVSVTPSLHLRAVRTKPGFGRV